MSKNSENASQTEILVLNPILVPRYIVPLDTDWWGARLSKEHFVISVFHLWAMAPAITHCPIPSYRTFFQC